MASAYPSCGHPAARTRQIERLAIQTVKQTSESDSGTPGCRRYENFLPTSRLILLMSPRDLRAQKAQEKRLAINPAFKTMKKGKCPKPFAKMGGPRLSCTDLIDVSPFHQVIFIWKDGQIRTDRSFYGWLFKKVSPRGLLPLLEMHWHPSHKGLHVKMPCNTEQDYLNRQLPGAPELGVNTVKAYDPKIESDRLELIEHFCVAAGIKIGNPETLWN